MIVLQKPFQTAKLVRLICKNRCLASLCTCFAYCNTQRLNQLHQLPVLLNLVFGSNQRNMQEQGTTNTLPGLFLPSRCSPPPARAPSSLSFKDSFLSYKSTPRCITGCVAAVSSGRRMKLSATAPTSLEPGQQPRPQEH
uniref:Uncharacterized protein n=1 Tax=Micrurus spixii TaxID=129469 RepID=A0A2D4NH79_9SAUR